MGAFAKQKGGSFERKTCSALSLWVSNLNREDVFYRSSQSGGRATFRSKRNPKSKHQFITQSGDISAIHPLGKMLLDLFMIECKHLQKIDVDTLAWEMGGCTYRYWQKLLGQSKQIKRMPMIIVKQNNRPTLVGTTKKGLKILYEGTDYTVSRYKRKFLSATYPYCDLNMMLFSNMIQLDFSKIRKAYGGMTKRIQLK